MVAPSQSTSASNVTRLSLKLRLLRESIKKLYHVTRTYLELTTTKKVRLNKLLTREALSFQILATLYKILTSVLTLKVFPAVSSSQSRGMKSSEMINIRTVQQSMNT
jgi:hypothetical protein